MMGRLKNFYLTLTSSSLYNSILGQAVSNVTEYEINGEIYTVQKIKTSEHSYTKGDQYPRSMR